MGTTQDVHKPAANGVLVQMEKDKDKEEDQEEKPESVRTETAELVNGDMGSSEQSDDHSPSQTERTDTETENEDTETKTEGEHRDEEGSADHKVSAEFKHSFCAPGTEYFYLLCNPRIICLVALVCL